MTNNNHPITPPPELFAEWFANSLKKLDRAVSQDDRGTTGLIAGEVAIQAARWGTDQELEACCEWLEDFNCSKRFTAELRAARRPKPPSLKDEVKQIIDCLVEGDCLNDEDAITLRRALEQLND